MQEKKLPGRPRKQSNQLSFIKAGDHELAPLLKALKKVSKEAIDMLVAGLQSPDEKVRLECAKTLLRYQIDISNVINTDTVQRLANELRFNNSGGGALKDIPSMPSVNFDEIQDV